MDECVDYKNEGFFFFKEGMSSSESKHQGSKNVKVTRHVVSVAVVGTHKCPGPPW